MTPVIPYYVRGHTAEGLVNFVESNLEGIENIYVLSHPSHQVLSDVLWKMVKDNDRKRTYEKIYSPYLANGLEGIIFREASYAILSVDVFDNDIATKIDVTKWLPYTKKLEEYNEVKELRQKAYEQFSEALHIHDDLEKVYIDEMDFAKADKVADQLLEQIFSKVPKRKNPAHMYKRLFGTNTIGGALNKVEELLAPINNRIYVKGRAGTGKSVLLKKVIDQSMAYGYDVEVYRCSFDPQSVDMVMIRDLDYCLFDSTAPHEFFPTQKTDQVVDLYEETVRSGTDEKYAKKIQQITKEYQSGMKKGLAHIQQLETFPMFQAITNESIDEDYATRLQKVIQEIKIN